MRIIFMGTPDFAVESLRKIVEAGFDVVAVITAADKAAGRGRKLRETPVKIFAASRNIPVLQPLKLKNPEFLAELKSYKADLQVVVAFRMLPEVVWAMPKLGTFNLHASILPQYRGAAPINWAIINGEKETGVSTFFIEKEIDTGKLIYTEKTSIGNEENAGSLHDRLMTIGAALVLKTVKAIETNNYPQTIQNESEVLNPAPKIFKEDCQINWNQEATKIHNFIRGLSPYPAAWTLMNELILKIYDCEIWIEKPDNAEMVFNNILTDTKTYLCFPCDGAWISIKELQLQGKKRMPIKDFLRGYRFNQ